MYSTYGDEGIKPGQVWKSRSADTRGARIVGIDYDTGKVKFEWQPTDHTHPWSELDLGEFVRRYERKDS